MKTLTKIALLAVFVIAAFAGVMIFEKTRVEPPIASNYVNQYTVDLQKSMESIPAAGTSTQRDSAFAVDFDRLLTFRNEEKIAPDEADIVMDKLLGVYIPLFLSDSYKKFSKSVWHEADHKYMLSVIDDLRSAMHSDFKLALSKQQSDSLSQIQGIIERYRLAKTISHNTTYRGVRDARNNIKEANELVKDL